jgi:hypothetical protein
VEGSGFELPVPRSVEARLKAKIAGLRLHAPVDHLRLPPAAMEGTGETDSVAEGNGFELPVPRPIGNNFEALSEMGTPC